MRRRLRRAIMTVMVITRRVATVVASGVLVTEVGVVVGIGIIDTNLVRRGYGDQFDGLTEPWAWLWVLAIAVPAAVGTVIVRSQPRHRVGWLFLGLSVSILFSAVLDEWFTLAAIVEPAELGGARVAAVLADKSFFPWWPLLTLILLLTPTGTYLSPRWRLVGRWTVGATLGSFLLSVTGTEPLNQPYARVGNPFAIAGLGDATRVGASLSFLVVAAGLVLSGLSLVHRWRLAQGEARRQLLWLVLAVAPLPALVPVHLFAVRTDSAWLTLVTLALFLALIPIAAGLSVMRYRLYDVDRIVTTTLTYAFLSIAVTAVYAVIVWVGSQTSSIASPSPAATATVGAVAAATVAAPLRTLIQQRLDRRFSRRAFDAVRVVREALAGDQAGVDPQELLRSALADSSLTVAYPGPSGWLDGSGASAPSPEHHILVARGGRTVARIGYDATQLEGPTVLRVGDAAAAELDNMRLRADLQRHLADLAESRARIADAQHAERRRIERDLHDGAQQSLLALAFDLQSAHLNADPKRMYDALEVGATSARDAVRQLRDLANGLHPQTLVEGGLTAVLDDLARRSPVPVTISCPPDRYPPALEFTCWLVIAEAVVNAQKHAVAGRLTVEVAHIGRDLRIRVQDDGRGGADPAGRGLRGLQDRVAAAGGRARILSDDTGTMIEATVPCAS